MSEIEVVIDENDDVGFVHEVRAIVLGAVRLLAPVKVYVVKVDNWFGDRWLGFSHKAVGLLGVQYRGELRVPPFVPDRVRSQRFYRRATTGVYEYGPAERKLHVAQPSEDNARRLMSAVCPDAAVFWWSGSSRGNRRGSLMAYVPTPEGHTGWYAELAARDTWVIANTVATTVHQLAEYVAAI